MSSRNDTRTPAAYTGIDFVVRTLVLAVVYFAAARFGRIFFQSGEHTAVIWLPAGIALAAFLIGGTRMWPGIVLGALAGALQEGMSPRISVVFTLGSVLEAYVATLLLRRIPGFHERLERIQDVLSFVFVGGGLAGTVNAFFATGGLLATGVLSWDAAGRTWVAFWLGDVVGIIVMAPLLLSWYGSALPTRTRRVIIEVMVLLVITIIVGIGVFRIGGAPGVTSFPLAYMAFPFVMWAAYRFGPRGAATLNLVTSVIAAWGAAHAQTSPGMDGFADNLPYLSAYLTVLCLTSLVFAAAISERDRTEERLTESQLFIERIAETSPVFLCVISLETGRFVYANRSPAAYLGYPTGASIPAIDHLPHPDDLPAVLAAVGQISNARDGEVIQEQLRVAHGSGSWHWISMRTIVFQRDAHGRPTQCLGIAQDITTERDALDALRQSEQRYKTFIEHSTEAVWRIEFEPPVNLKMTAEQQRRSLLQSGTIAECNDAFARQYGRASASDLVGRPWTDVFDPAQPDNATLLNAIIRNAFVLSNAESQGRGERGEPLSFMSNIVGIIQNGLLRRLWWTQRDVTQLREAEERLIESQRLVQGIAGAIPDLLYVNDLIEKRNVYVNRELAAILGYTPEEVRAFGDDVMGTLLHPDDRDLVRSISTRLRSAADGEIIETQYRVRHRDGEWRWFASRDTLFTRTPDGTPALSLGTAQDITRRKQAEEEIRKLNEDLERRVARRTAELEMTNKELEAFSYSVSHDLRAPLRAIDGYAHILQEDHGASLNNEAARILGAISRNSRQMGELVDDLLSFSRLNRKPVESSRIDMDHLVRTVVAEATNNLAPPLPHITVEPLPPAEGDASMVRQVWTNLISNAIKFSRRSTPAVIVVRGRIESERHVYSVSDNGIGIDMKYAHKLFGVFERLHPQDEFEGTGVGLAIVQRIVERHGGSVWADGDVGTGATFSFTLPAQAS